MAGKADDFRAKAKIYNDASATLIEKFEPATKNVVAAIVGQVNGELYTALADMLDYQAAQPAAIRLEQMRQRSERFSAEQDAIRKAAAVGASDVDWNRIISGSTEPVASGAG